MSVFDLLEFAKESSAPGAKEFAAYLSECGRKMETLNPLSRLVLRAELLDSAWSRSVEEESHLDLGGVITPVSEIESASFPAITIEEGGVIGVVEWARSHPRDRLAIFSNDLAYTRFGLDMVVKDRRTDRFIVVEAKGTTLPIRGPASYLKKTKRKGRQMSWRWCWHSLCEFAHQGAAARIFLQLYRPLLEGDVGRMVVITRLEARDGSYFPVETEARDIESIGERDWIHDLAALRPQRGWLKEISSARFDEVREFVSPVTTLVAAAFADGEPPEKREGENV